MAKEETPLLKRRALLVAFRDQRIAHEKAQFGKMFMGTPDRWFEDPSWGCANGHVSRRYLRCEEDGNVCLACHSPIYLLPPEVGEARLAEILHYDYQHES